MNAFRSIVYAEAQARIRARIGSMPDADTWRRFAGVNDLDHLIERMRDQGLAGWVSGLPRNPDSTIVEIHLQEKLLERGAELAGWLPPSWARVQAWIEVGLGLLFIRRVLVDTAAVLPRNADPVLQQVVGMPLNRRLTTLSTTAYARYVGIDSAPNAWVAELQARLPGMSRHESQLLRRLGRLAASYAARLRAARRAVGDAAAPTGEPVQWRLESELAGRLRNLSAGDPFHGGLILIYGFLEWLQFQRCLALLIARAHRWPAPDVTGNEI